MSGIGKKELRRLVRERISAMTQEEKTACSEALCGSIKSHLAVCGARIVALFSPLPDEPQIWSLVEELAESRLVALPRVEGDVMRFYCMGEMKQGAFGIMEPQGALCIEPGEIDAIVVPGVAFTLSGKRMGRGKGFYDKYMSHPAFRALKIGICYPPQLVDELPCEGHDVVMDCVLIK